MPVLFGAGPSIKPASIERSGFRRKTCNTSYPGATGSTTIPLGVETRFDRLTLGCKDGVPTLRVSWKGGSFDVPAEAVGLIGDDAVLEGGRCKGKALP